jgi:hypothetical protein
MTKASERTLVLKRVCTQAAKYKASHNEYVHFIGEKEQVDTEELDWMRGGNSSKYTKAAFIKTHEESYALFLRDVCFNYS